VELNNVATGMDAESPWKASPVQDGYRVTYNDDTISLAVIVSDPAGIEAQRHRMLEALKVLRGEVTTKADHSDVSLPPLTLN